jgi:hypothetical protein
MVPDVVGYWMMGSWDSLREGKAPSGVMKHGESASFNRLLVGKSIKQNSGGFMDFPARHI